MEILVFASPTLTEVFDALAADFSALHPDIAVINNYVDAETAAGQLRQGAPADVFASPDTAHMDMVADLTLEPAVFARNELAIVVGKDAAHPEQAQAFVGYVLSPQGQATLERAGFLPAAEHWTGRSGSGPSEHT